MKARHAYLLCVFISILLSLPGVRLLATQTPIRLGGEWRFAMDRDDAGIKQQWFTRNLSDRIKLPGILQSQGYGDEISIDTPWVAALPRDMKWYLLPQYQAYTKPGNVKMPYLSQPQRHYLGLAWYQRDIDVFSDWKGKRVHLFLERPRWETTVWIDDNRIGSNNSLCAPHEYDLGILSPGRHRLTVRVDNRMSVVPGYRVDGHSVSDALGSTWNGIAGRIELTATSPVWIDDVQVFPNVEKKSALIRVKIGNLTGQAGAGTLIAGNAKAAVKWDANGGEAELEAQLDANAQPWDEFHPLLHRLAIRITGGQADDQREAVFGLREIKAQGKQFLLNGREINLRGTHSGGDFPLTGYPATDVASWKKIFQTCKDFGLNHMRFHSWCPPEAAFMAADEIGFYLQPECGMWNSFSPGTPMVKMLEDETSRIVKAYGNHPSFLLLSASNETSGNWQPVLIPWTTNWYKTDPRRLYCTNTGRSSATAEGAQFANIPYRSASGWFGRDYSASLRSAIMPVLAHEVGQWCAYPDFDIIKKFTGYLRPGNYEIFRDSAITHGMLDKNKEFSWASGKFQLECYKQEIEANFRTPGAAGFQLLDLHDYLGQGGALVGLLDAFWAPKSYVTAKEFRRFCGPTAPLARLMKNVLKASEPFEVDAEIAHYGAGPIAHAKPFWKIINLAGQVIVQGKWSEKDIPIGKNITLGKVAADLAKLPAPQEYKLVVGLQDTQFENDWRFWLYPDQVDAAVPADVTVTTDWSAAALRLSGGGKVLFTPPLSSLDDTSPPLNDVPVFWNRLMNPKLEAMMGLWIDSKHPALEQFPTETYCDWEWIDAIRLPRTATGARFIRAINIEKAPAQLQPIVQAIDDWSRNYKLAVIFECKVGSGRLMVCAPDIQNDLNSRPVARQLRSSLLAYMATDRFQPVVTLDYAQASALWPRLAKTISAPAVPAPQALPGDIIENPSAPQPKSPGESIGFIGAGSKLLPVMRSNAAGAFYY
jgi:beta-galactosidase